MADPNRGVPSLIVKSKTLHCKNLYDYLKTLSAGTLERLYNHPNTCLAVYRLDKFNF